MANLNDIFGWFGIGKRPTAQQFRDTFSSFWHKSERFPLNQVLGLNDALREKADKEAINALINGVIRQDAVDTYYLTEGKTSLLGEYPNPEKGWDVLVRDENTRYNWNGIKWVNVETGVYDEDVKTIIENLHFAQDHEFMFAVLGSNNQLLWGIRWNMSIYEVSIPLKTAEALKEKLNKADVLQILENSENPISAYAVKAAIDAINSKIQTLNNYVSEIEDTQFLKADIDANGHILGGYKENGEIYFPKGQPEETKQNIKQINDKIKYLELLEDSSSIEEVPENHLQMILDRNRRILSIRTGDNALVEKKIVVEQELDLKQTAMLSFIEALKKSGFTGGAGDYTGQNNIKLPIPKQAGHLNIIANKLPTGKTDDILSILELYYEGIYLKCYAINNAQGTSSLGYENKNNTYDLYVFNPDGSVGDELNIQFGDWVSVNSVYGKSFYIDVFRGIAVVSYRICLEMYDSLPYGERRPWEYITLANTTAANGEGNLKYDLGTGAKGVSDGFAVMRYFNGEPYSIVAISLKKDRGNLMMDKNNSNHIWLDGVLDYASLFSGSQQWHQFEVRNRKGLRNTQEEKYNEGDELSDNDPASAYVKDKIKRLSSAMPAINANKTKENFEKYFLHKFVIEYDLHGQVFMNFDGYAKNWQWCTWDGDRWAPMFHDHDSLFSMFYNGIVADLTVYDPSSTILGTYGWQPTAACKELYAAEYKARYKQLRDLGIFSTDHIIGKLEEWIRHVGYDNYKTDLEKWDETPSYRNPHINSEYWEFYKVSSSNEYNFHNESVNYKTGDLVRYGATDKSVCIFKCIKDNIEQKPLTKLYPNYPYEMGFYNSPERIRQYLDLRFKSLDAYYEYK